MKRISVFLAALIISALTFTSSEAARWPTNNWSQTCGFWVTCAADLHTGVDGKDPTRSIPGTPVYMPISGTIREAQYHGGYGGTFLIEGRGQGETVTIILGHNEKPNSALDEKWYEEGTQIGTLASKGYWSGNYDPHSHMGIHRGKYCAGCFACGGGWIYLGYAQAQCEKSNWYDPNVWIRFTNAYNRVGGESKLGSPVTDFLIPAGCWQREYSGGSYGRCMLVWNGSPTQIYLIRTGFYEKYVSMGATKSWLGAPTGDEFVTICTPTCNVSRQNFKNGYMIWDCTGSVKVYNGSGAQVTSVSPVMDETPTVTPTLMLAISPNPTRMSPTIRFSLPAAGEVSLDIFDVAGRKVATLISGPQSAGEQSVAWSRMTDNGQHVGAGLYFVRLVTPTQTLSRQLTILN